MVTTNWRAYPVNLPEDAFIGVLYANVVQTGDIVVYNASNWVFNTTGLQNGSHLPGLMGVEVDTLGSNTPPGTVLVAQSPYQFQGSTLYSDMTVYTASSGATVFAAGTMIFSWGLDNYNGGQVSPAAQQMTRNLLARFISDRPPVSNPGGPYTANVSQGLQFSGTASSDPDGTIITYQWDFGDGSTGTGATPTHTYSAIGTYTVTLIVTDNSGSRNSAQTTANISNPSSATLSSVAVSPTSVTGGGSAHGKVTLSGAAPTGGATVTLTSSNTAAAQVPASVTVAAGATTTTFSVTTSSVTSSTSVTLSGSYNGSVKTASLTVNSASVSGQIAFVQQKIATYSSASSVVATLAAAPHPGSALVLFSANNNVSVTAVTGGGVTWVQSSSGGTHSAIDIWYGLNSSGSGTAITVTYANATGSGGVNLSEFSGIATSNALDVAPATTSGISTNPTTPTAVTNNAFDLIVGAAAVTNVAPTTAGPTNSFTALSEAANLNKIVPAYRIVSAAGSYNTSWTESNDGWDTAIVALKAAGTTSTVSLSSVAVSPSSVTGGSSSTGTVTLSGAAPAGGATVTLTSSNTTAAQVPASVTVAAGATTATFSITTSSVANSTSVTLSGSYNGSVKTATLTVNPASTVSLSSVAVSPTTVTGGSSSSGTVTLSGAAPTGGATVTLTSSNTTAAQVPANVTVAAGATTATFSVTTSSVTSSTSVTLSGSYNGSVKTATLTVNPASTVSLSSVAVSPTTVTGGSSSSGTVTLSGAAPTGGATVTLTSSNTAAAQVPANVTVVAGATTATFSVTTSSVTSSTSVTLSGSYNGSVKTASLTVNSASVSGQIAFVQQKIATYSSASSVVATLAAAPHPGSALVLFSANNNVSVTAVTGGGVTWVQSSSGGTHSAIDIWYGLNSSGSGTAITVTYANATGSGGVNLSEFSGIATSNALDVAPATTSGISTNPTTPTAVTNNAFDLIVGAAAVTNVAPTTAGPTNSFTALSEAANLNKIVPAYRIVSAAGSYNTSWTESNDGWDTAIVALKAAGTTSTVSLSSVAVSPSSVTGGSSSTGTVTLSGAAPAGGATVTLTSSNTTAAQVPASVTVAAGATTATFSITTSSVANSTSVTLSGSYNGSVKTATLTVNPASTVSLSSVAVSPTTVTGGSSSSGTVTLSGAAPTGGATVTLTSSNTAAAQVPANVTVVAGATTATFSVTTSSVTSSTSVTLSGSYNGSVKTASLTVNSASVSGQIAFVQQKIATYSSASSVVATLAAAPHPGSALVLFSANNNVSVTAVTGGGVTWVQSSSGGTHSAIDIWYGLNSSGSGTAITVTYANATGSGGVNLSEFSGIATSNALDVAPATTSGISTSPTTPSAVTTNAHDLIVGAVADTDLAATTGGPTNSFTALTEAANANKIVPAYRIVSATGSYNTSWTEGNDGWDTAILALKSQ